MSSGLPSHVDQTLFNSVNENNLVRKLRNEQTTPNRRLAIWWVTAGWTDPLIDSNLDHKVAYWSVPTGVERLIHSCRLSSSVDFGWKLSWSMSPTEADWKELISVKVILTKIDKYFTANKVTNGDSSEIWVNGQSVHETNYCSDNANQLDSKIDSTKTLSNKQNIFRDLKILSL